MAIKNADGLISVSTAYIDDLKARYPEIKNIPSATITFGAFEPDMIIAGENKGSFSDLLGHDTINIVYIGRGGGAGMHRSVIPVFKALRAALKNDQSAFNRLKFYFIGTSYAPLGKGKPTVKPLAEKYGIGDRVIEITDRVSYYHALATLMRADALFIPGSDDSRYTASKIYPYLLTGKPLLAVFNPESSAISILKEYGAAHVYNYEQVSQQSIISFLKQVIDGDTQTAQYSPGAIDKYSAQQMTAQQCDVFNRVINE